MASINPLDIKSALQQARNRDKLPNWEHGPFDQFYTSHFADGIVSASKIQAVKQEIARITAAGASPDAIRKAEHLLTLCEQYKKEQNLGENILAKFEDWSAKLDELDQRGRKEAAETIMANGLPLVPLTYLRKE